jgi:hypothetical protein
VPLVKLGSENHRVNLWISGLNLRIKAVCPAVYAHHAMGWLSTATQQGQAQVIRERWGEVGATGGAGVKEDGGVRNPFF